MRTGQADEDRKAIFESEEFALCKLSRQSFIGNLKAIFYVYCHIDGGGHKTEFNINYCRRIESVDII